MKNMASVPVEIVPASISQDILNNEDVVDLFICLAYSAASTYSNTKEKLFKPFPEVCLSS
jgi:hypothetical protein